MYKTIYSLLVFSFIISNLFGCAHPTVVETVQDSDYTMTCSELTKAIDDARHFRKEAQGKKGFTGGNVTRGILLWPTILGTYSNANEAIHAADARIVHLSHIKAEKCDHNLGGSPEKIELSNKSKQENKEEL